MASKKTKNCYWVSWYQPTKDYRPMAFPPGEPILGWWCTGHADEGATICAVVAAPNESAAWKSVRADWPEAVERFCEPGSRLVGERFVIAPWMVERGIISVSISKPKPKGKR